VGNGRRMRTKQNKKRVVKKQPQSPQSKHPAPHTHEINVRRAKIPSPGSFQSVVVQRQKVQEKKLPVGKRLPRGLGGRCKANGRPKEGTIQRCPCGGVGETEAAGGWFIVSGTVGLGKVGRKQEEPRCCHDTGN